MTRYSQSEYQNKFDPLTVALMHDVYLKQKLVDLVPLHLSKIFVIF